MISKWFQYLTTFIIDLLQNFLDNPLPMTLYLNA
jgi:hypothetical protein